MVSPKSLRLLGLTKIVVVLSLNNPNRSEWVVHIFDLQGYAFWSDKDSEWVVNENFSCFL